MTDYSVANKRKDPSDETRYSLNWGPWLSDGGSSAEIDSSAWVAEEGISIKPGTATHDATTVSLILAGGTAGEEYRITNTIATDEGQKFERSFIVRVRQL